MKFSQIKTKLQEATTIKAQSRGLLRALDEMLTDKKISAELRRQIEDVRTALKRTWAELAKDAEIPSQRTAEAVSIPADKEDVFKKCKTKTMADGKDEESAYAICYSQVVEGKTEAEAIKECGDMAYSDAPMYSNPAPLPRSFSALIASRAANETAEKMRQLVYDLQTVLDGIVAAPDADYIAEFQTAFDEVMQLLGEMTGANLAAAESDKKEPEGTKLAESFDGASIVFDAAELAETTPSPRDPLRLDVRMIKPGLGNASDRNWYPAEVLKRDAKVFEGSKMYTTDHKQGEKSERTEVSIIEKIKGFDSDGAPIAQVLVFDPDFAEKTRNRAKANMLKTLECSILAYGKTKPGTSPDGQKVNIVEAITAAQSVDWVTKAGAGGHAVSLAESSQGTGAIMDKDLVLKTLKESALPEPAQKRLEVREFKDEAELTTAITAEVAYLKEATTPAQTAPVLLAEADVKATLAKTQLPAASQKRLAEVEYKDNAALDAAVKAEVAYLKEVTGSGKPFVPQSQTQDGNRPKTLAETNKTVDDLLTRRFGGVVAKTKGA